MGEFHVNTINGLLDAIEKEGKDNSIRTEIILEEPKNGSYYSFTSLGKISNTHIYSSGGKRKVQDRIGIKNAKNCTISGVQILQTRNQSMREPSRIYKSENIKIKNSKFHSIEVAENNDMKMINVESGNFNVRKSKNSILRNCVSERKRRMRTERTTSIDLKECENITVKDSKIDREVFETTINIGIYITNSKNITLENNKITNCERGILVRICNHLIIDDSAITNYENYAIEYKEENEKEQRLILENHPRIPGKDPIKNHEIPEIEGKPSVIDHI